MRHKEKGYTLIEVLLGVPIMAAVGTAAIMLAMTLLINYGEAAEQNTDLPQVQSAGYWISRDVQMAENLTASDPNGFPLSLNIPTDLDEDNNTRIDYVLEGNNLIRKFYDSSDFLLSETLVATQIVSSNTTFSIVNPTIGFYSFMVTASRNGPGVTHTYEITKRVAQD